MSASQWPLADSTATEAMGAALATALLAVPARGRATLATFSGELGAGKTTMVRGLLRRLGVRGAIKSPSYTLVEPYQVGERLFCHLDLYRIGDPEELEFLGLRDYLSEAHALLIEWPERAQGALPSPDLCLRLAYAGAGRALHMQYKSERGADIRNAFRGTAE